MPSCQSSFRTLLGQECGQASENNRISILRIPPVRRLTTGNGTTTHPKIILTGLLSWAADVFARSHRSIGCAIPRYRMGSRDRQKQLWSYRVNLDKRVIASIRNAENRLVGSYSRCDTSVPQGQG